MVGVMRSGIYLNRGGIAVVQGVIRNPSNTTDDDCAEFGHRAGGALPCPSRGTLHASRQIVGTLTVANDPSGRHHDRHYTNVWEHHFPRHSDRPHQP